ncbi:MAG: tetratricopeptide repeat protein, partial [Pirellulaceae bacterium]|nr:tetratricopeptide repeat protein [Pirellulaceae bacterium]
MFTCPACGAEPPDRGDACRCGADLSLLRSLDAVPDAWFNRALEELAQNRPGRALEWLAACCTARPNDAAALRALAQVWGQLGHPAEAEDALRRSAAIDPDHPQVKLIHDAVRTLRRN